MKRYAQEFVSNWSNLLGAAMGVSMGISLYQYTANVFGPSLVREFGWSRAEFALLGFFPLINIVFYPIIGRLTDRLGARAAAAIGFTAIPAAFMALSFMSGNIYEFYAIVTLKSMFGIMTSSLVFSRVVVERFVIGRGLALSLVMSAPPLVASASVIVAGYMIEAEGWRDAYRLLALLSAVAGLVAIILIGKSKRPDRPLATSASTAFRGLFDKEARALLRQPVFLVMVGGMFLVNLPQNLVSTQLGLVYQQIGVSFAYATWLVSLYPVSVLIGRILTGLALDSIRPHLIALLFLGAPAVSLLLLAMSLNVGSILVVSILVVGIAQGAEGDIGAFITSRKFEIKDYGLIYSMLIVAMTIASALGSLLLSLTLLDGGSYSLFLIIGAITTVAGAVLFYFTGRHADAGAREPDAERLSAR